MKAPATVEAGVLARIVACAVIAGVLTGGAMAIGLHSYAAAISQAPAADPELATIKATFRRPATVPFPASNAFTEAKRALGERLFHDKRLSIDGSMACASCHIRSKGFADGRKHGRGVPGRPLERHTPTLWNLAWASPVFWDGRARSLEEQVAGPIETPDEMGQPVASLTALLATDPAYSRLFAAAFPKHPTVSADNLAKAIATFERTLVSPPTRFDRWIEGDTKALTPDEVAGFRLFTGKARCSNCHTGWAFTDYAFHDIGLPGEDRGRGAVLRLEAADHAFKTPSLREIGRSAPYMHDGSQASLSDVVRHYESGIVERSSLSADLPRDLELDDRERGQLLAFLGTLTSENEPMPPSTIIATNTREIAAAERVRTVTQHDRSFSPTHVALSRGGRLWILNNDTRTHNIRVFDPALDFDSGAQEPGETVEIAFPAEGSFLVFCGIHPKMELHVDVEP